MASTKLGKHARPLSSAPGTRALCTLGMLSEGAAALAIGVALFGMVILAGGMAYMCKVVFLMPNWALLIAACVFVALIVAVCSGRLGKSLAAFVAHRPKAIDIAVGIACLLLLVVQIRLCRYYAFVTGWDSGVIVTEAWNIANDGALSITSYLSRYPNNLFLLWIAGQCGRIALALGFSTLDGLVFVFSILNCVSCALAMWFVYRTLSMAASRTWGLAGFLLCILVIWTSPWAGIMYSDAIVVCVPAVLAYLFISAHRSKGAKRVVLFALMGLVGVLGYKIKPQVLFMLFAVGFLLLVRLGFTTVRAVRERRAECVGETSASLVALMVGGLVAFSLVGALVAPWTSQLDEDAQFGMTHFLMMGMNPDSRGVYWEEDVTFSGSFDDPASRSSGNLEVVIDRVKEYGPVGLAGLFGDKLMTNFNDGTFAWGQEGHFFDYLPPESDSALASLVRSFYYPEGANYDLWRTYAQFVWILVLACCFVGLISSCTRSFLNRKSGMADGLVTFTFIVSLSMLMLIVFELLFEARARYLYSSVTLFIFFAVFGMRWMLSRARAWRASH